ncbi:hypothetical protein IE81DRAFT_367653 [Ceraceosorus guamensis]|uniref:Sacsin/Nov domain-containing protein n=1 Tax=Ceraceosorus guamensis TaxID=1522189 RepID=A0A316VUT0_9BASI|nr:hypothetical protein IE81DRAFT_367653 [Ceraceosorus guamensis]PWN41182.1 hypothetical protein IE81DRAFT_367653 [Ceraceosorus guamensis]
MNEAARRALLESGEDEAVTVNQRALIDKILARYAAEFTIFRELIQNADDAGATTCELRFESAKHCDERDAATTPLSAGDPLSVAETRTAAKPKSPDFTATLRNWVFKNDGAVFNDQDWTRLKRIAEGNPDESKIGAFGVGFYSLFSVSEEPLVASGADLMGFFWRTDSLFTRRAKAPTVEMTAEGKPWTSFYLPLREPAPLADSVLDLTRFLATSLTFTTRVRNLDLYWDDVPLALLSKQLSKAQPLAMPSHLNATSPQRMMRATRLDATGLQLDVKVSQAILRLVKEEQGLASIKASLANAFTKSSGTSSGGFGALLGGMFGRSTAKAKAAEASAAEALAAEQAQQALEKAKAADAAAAAARSATELVEASIHISVATATITVTADKAFSKEIERSTKKPPPRETKVSIIKQSLEEHDASLKGALAEPVAGAEESAEVNRTRRGLREVFKGVLPSLEEQGYVFIGFKTSQSSGFAGNLAARFIPTVEREAIDFIDRYCAIWNNELLAMCGYLTRATYEAELARIATFWDYQVGNKRPKDDNSDAARALDKALHTMRYLTFKPSTPAARVSTVLETNFFAAARQNTLTLASTRGVKPSAQIRFPNAELAEFVKDLAVIPPAHIEKADVFMLAVKTRGLARDITIDDVFGELSNRALSPPEMVAALKWWLRVAAHPSFDSSLQQRFLDAAIVSCPATEKAQEKAQPLNAVEHWLNPQRIPPEMSCPPSCLAYEVSKELSTQELLRVFGWKELNHAVWLRYLVRSSSSSSTSDESTNLQLSPEFAERVLGILARAWGQISSSLQKEVTEVLSNVTCIPTAKGMSKPADAYMPQVVLFPDLPTVALPSTPVKGNTEKLLQALGVRRHVQLQLVFDRLVGAGAWDVTQLLAYLATNRDSLSKLELDRLRKTPMFREAPKKGETQGPRRTASQLYEPLEELIALGLPTLDWPGKSWRATSEEAKFAFNLGLLKFPPPEQLLELASKTSDDIERREKALAYFFKHFELVYAPIYSRDSMAGFAFVPALQGEERTPVLLGPNEVFKASGSLHLGLAIVDEQKLAKRDIAKLGLREHPTGAKILRALQQHPPITTTIPRAKRIFEYLAGTSELSGAQLATLKSTPFIPILKTKTRVAAHEEKAKASPDISLQAPSDCYFASVADPSSGSEPLWADVFSYIDFGPETVPFLRACGVTAQPTVQEIAARAVRQPARFFAAGEDAYLGILRSIAASWNQISQQLRAEMRASPFLLATKRVESTAKADDEKVADEDVDDLDELGSLVHLKAASEIVVNDDPTSYLLFGSMVYCAPMEDALQELYTRLGSPALSSLIEQKWRTEGRPQINTPTTKAVRQRILERTPLFFFEQQLAKSDIHRDVEWLKKETNFEVVEVPALSSTRMLRFHGISSSRATACTALASSTGGLLGGKLILYLVNDPDLYEVAEHITRNIINRRRGAQMVPLYHILLSASLMTLKRRGFHVDKIIAQHKAAQRDQREAMAREERKRAELEAIERSKEPPPISDAQFAEWQRQVLARFPDADPQYVDSLLRSLRDDHLERAASEMTKHAYPKTGPGSKIGRELSGSKEIDGLDEKSGFADTKTPGGGGILSNWRSRLSTTRQRDGPSSLAAGTSSIDPGPSLPGAFDSLIAAAGRSSQGQSGVGGSLPLGTGGRSGNAEQPSGLADIRKSVMQAIHASRPENAQSIEAERQSTQVKEAEQTYCDQTTGANLKLVGHVAETSVYLSPELDPRQTMDRNGAALKRFITRVLKPVAVDVFGIDPRAISVFCDVVGPAVAFNRGGHLFFNLRYYLAWHDEQVKNNNLTVALISTASSVAHEVAHNLVAQHDSQHEWYMQSIAEEFFLPMAALVAKCQRERQQLMS